MLLRYLDGRELVAVECSVLVPVHVAGECDLCSAELPPGRTRWCSRACALAYEQNHVWTAARSAAKRRDRQRCVSCGSSTSLEVNHLVPREGRGYGWGCHHHLTNLETLCHECHVLVTQQQAALRRLAAGPLLSKRTGLPRPRR